MRTMMALDDGLQRIEQHSQGRLILLYEDPETFGAGHFVLHPLHGSSPRFAIEEKYPPGVDWADEDRVPVSWTWASEARLPQPDGSWTWVTLAEGEVASADYETLLHITGGWADALGELIAREEALTADPISDDGAGRSEPGRTFLT
ncbi:hypothetical protein JSO19_06800 [Leucobacter sp. UCMA 4100]|uniref:hypothetical protein n=1 Tax=Leucobacter sp. UCMA 4100 TaxID=2810534 RepID=UPI0022EB3371|nr:hypothetical protein [Leucobacter sp. UCMA 4100]MDA3147084.1 hypothetical protein [Leucobacter sp. UCMA 4100]